jgi:prepilin-type processing-associated H-X9-DG protein
MNDYARAQNVGQAVSGAGNIPYATYPNYHTGLSQAAMQKPAELILITETAQRTDGSANRNASPFFNSGVSAFSPLCMGMPQKYHANKSDFLFADGHVKALTPGATWGSADQNDWRNFNAPTCTTNAQVEALGIYTGGRSDGDGSMWNPNAPTRGNGYP